MAGRLRTQPETLYSTTATREPSRFSATAAATWPGTSASAARWKFFANPGKSDTGLGGNAADVPAVGRADQSFWFGLICQTLTESVCPGRPGTLFAQVS